MANIHSTVTSLFTDIASAIREKNGSTEAIEASAFPSAIRAIRPASSVYSEFEEQRITGTLTEYTNSSITQIGQYAFAECKSLISVNFPACTIIGTGAFDGCTNLATVSFPVCTTIEKDVFAWGFSLTTVNFPACTTIGKSAFTYARCSLISFPACTIISDYAFGYCRLPANVSFPVCTMISDSAFFGCSSLTTASFPACTTIGRRAFANCYNLKSLYLTGSSICSLSESNAFTSTPIGGYSTSAGTYGSIYVPTLLLASYQAAENWSYFSSRFIGI